ncbi:MAG TPA: FAD-binding oxidoreductase [Planctomycetaceae bacterium]|nr:FAD-binding oxidoreductase [Planctomycetaceae bacterium]
MKWWGWGSEEIRKELPHSSTTRDYLRTRLGVEQFEPRREFQIQSLQLPESRADPALLSSLAAIVGAENCRTDHRERVLHSIGKSYKDLVRIRQLALERATDAVVYPRSEAEVVAVLSLCREARAAVVPFGGGTSVVGGIEPEAGEQRVVVTLDLAYLNRVLAIDEVSQTATVEAGIFGPELESHLSQRGLTMGHYPQSFEFSTLGGWIATRSSGQNSLAYGGIEKLVESLRVVTPEGTIETLHVPRRADGPDVGQMLIGSEGVYGVIVSATVRVRRAPAERDYFMYALKDFPTGIAAARELIQSGAAPSLVRVADEEETAASLALGSRGGSSGLRSTGRRLLRKTIEWRLERRGIRPQSMATLLVGLEGSHDENARQRRFVREQLRHADCVYLGRTLGMRWLTTRFDLPYLRDELLDNHLLVDTLETATTWARLLELYAAVRGAIEQAAAAEGEPIIVFTHVSHLYRDGASLYFSLLGRQKRSDPLGQWRAIKRAAGDAIRAQGAVISHHHGVGQDHREQTGRTPIEHKMLVQLKQTLDPAAIMNPGKLL